MPAPRLLFAALALAGTVLASDIPISILEPPDRGVVLRNVPVAVGLVFPSGEMTSPDAGGLRDDTGRALPFDSEVTGWWEPERRNVKWLLLRFRADTDRRYVFSTDGKPLRPEGPAMAAERDGLVEVNTGPLRVTLRQGGGRLIDSAELNGRPMLAEGGIEQILTLTFSDGAATLKDWRVAIEESTPDRTLLRGTGRLATSWSEAAATVDVRMELHRGESFVRVWHTLTWRVANAAIGARDYALILQPLPEANVIRMGLEDAAEFPALSWTGKPPLYAHQDRPDHFSVEADGKSVGEGKRLAGWVAVERPDGLGVAVAVRDFWQTYPKAFALNAGRLRVELWSSRGPPMGFQFQDIMPPDFYNDAKYWNRFKWVENRGHFVHEFGTNPHFVHTPEGMARTHEIAVHFFDNLSRPPSQINLITQHPVIARQDPASAMRVPFLGFQIEPVRADYPEMERAIEQIGRMTVGRWVAGHDYGLLRYGMIRWAGTGVSYRWFDGVQYDLQIIPWLLFMRGGDRRWLEEAEVTARYAMDVQTNHFNTRGLPTGYQSAATGMPFPWHAAFLSKAPKINFLAYYYHLTGYKRAKDVMDEIIAGNKKTAGPAFPQPAPEHRGGHGRELYNMNSFWPNAWEETWDPEIKELAREWLTLTTGREFNAALGCFRAPCVYIAPGLVLQYGLWGGDGLRDFLCRYLDTFGYPRLQDGGVYSPEIAPLADWALRATGDRRYAKAAWDVARTLADLVADHNWRSPDMPDYPDSGNQFYRQFLLPIIAGYSNAARLGMQENDAFDLRDTFLSLIPAGDGKSRADILLRPRADGDPRVRLIFGGEVSPNTPDVTAVVRAADGLERIRVVIPATERAPVQDNFYPPAWFIPQRGEITLAGARKGELLRLQLEADAKFTTLVLVLADADLVQRIPAATNVFLYNLAGQYYVGTRLFSRSVADEITLTNEYNKPFTVRDAITGEVLYRYDMVRDRFKPVKVSAGRDRLLQFTMTGRSDVRRFTGLSPWFSRTRDEWFAPPAE